MVPSAVSWPTHCQRQLTGRIKNISETPFCSLAFMLTPIEVPAKRPSASHHSTAQIDAILSLTERCRPRTYAVAFTETFKGRCADLDVPGRESSFGTSQQLRKLIPSL